MRKKISLAFGVLGIVALVAFQWAIIIKAPQQNSFDSRASAQTIDSTNRIVVIAVADTYVSSRNPSENYGRERKLSTVKEPKKTTYIKFDLRSYQSAQLTEVSLKIKSRNYSKGQAVSLVSSSDWDEYQLNFTNQPSIVQSTSYFPTREDLWNTVIIQKELIQPYMGKFLTLALDDTNNSQTSYYSRETSSPPQLLISAVYPTIKIDSPQTGSTVSPNFDMNYTVTNWNLGLNNNKFAKILIDGKNEGMSYNNVVNFRGLDAGDHMIELSLATMDGMEIAVKDGIKVTVVSPLTPSITPSPVRINKIEGLKISTTPNGVTLNWDIYPNATNYAIYRHRLVNGSTPGMSTPGTLIATISQNTYTDTVSQVRDLFIDDSVNYFYTIKALNGSSEVAVSDVAGEFDYDLVKNKILFISFPYVSVPFADFKQLADVLRLQGFTSLNAAKWNPATQQFRLAIWNNSQPTMISGDNFTIEPYDTVVFQSYTRVPDQTGTVVFSGVFPAKQRTFQLIKGINMIPVVPSSVFTQATQLGNAVLPQAVKVFNTKDTTGPDMPFIQYTSGSWTGSDFPLYKGAGYFVEVAGDVTLTQ